MKQKKKRERGAHRCLQTIPANWRNAISIVLVVYTGYHRGLNKLLRTPPYHWGMFPRQYQTNHHRKSKLADVFIYQQEKEGANIWAKETSREEGNASGCCLKVNKMLGAGDPLLCYACGPAANLTSLVASVIKESFALSLSLYILSLFPL